MLACRLDIALFVSFCSLSIALVKWWRLRTAKKDQAIDGGNRLRSWLSECAS